MCELAHSQHAELEHDANCSVIASEAKKSSLVRKEELDCFVARAPRNDSYPLNGEAKPATILTRSA
jgi:hypothetical protein